MIDKRWRYSLTALAVLAILVIAMQAVVAMRAAS